MILAGDVGGTKVELAIYRFDHGQLALVRDERFPAHEYAGLQEIVARFLKESDDPEITAACFGVPGPVRGGRLRLTNLPWVLDNRELLLHFAKQLGAGEHPLTGLLLEGGEKKKP